MSLPFGCLTLPRGVSIALTNRTIDDAAASPLDAHVAYIVGNDGKVYKEIFDTIDQFVENWMDAPLGDPAGDYEVKATLNSGSVDSGTTGSWLALSTSRRWTRDRAADAGGTNTAELLIEIRKVGTSVTLASATITLSASVI